VEAVLQQVEDLAALLVEDHELAVEDIATLRELDLREVAAQRLAAARLEVDVLPIHVRERPEAVVLRLVHPVLPLREDLSGERQLRLYRGLQGQGDVAILIAA
jgi:hypothetical protein